MLKRLGFVGIIIQDRKISAGLVNTILSEFGQIIIGRMGIPHLKDQRSIITLIVEATTDELGALTGKLGKIPGVSVKSGLGKTDK